MKKQFLHSLKLCLLAGFALIAASCAVTESKRSLAAIEAATIASSYGESSSASASADEAAAKLAGVAKKYPDDRGVQAEIAFRIAMLRTNTGTRSEANAAWQTVAEPLTSDQKAMYESRDSLVWFFAKPSTGAKSVRNDGAFDDENPKECQACADAVVGFAGIGSSGGISPDLKLWAALNRAQIALIHDNSLGKGSNPRVSLPDARANLDQTRQSTGIDKYDRLIQRLKATRGYNG